MCVFLVRCVFVRSVVRVFVRYSGVFSGEWGQGRIQEFVQEGVINSNRVVEGYRGILGYRGLFRIQEYTRIHGCTRKQ